MNIQLARSCRIGPPSTAWPLTGNAPHKMVHESQERCIKSGRGFTRKWSVQFLPKGALGDCLLFEIFSSRICFRKFWDKKNQRTVDASEVGSKTFGPSGFEKRWWWCSSAEIYLVYGRMLPLGDGLARDTVTLQISYDNMTTKYGPLSIFVLHHVTKLIFLILKLNKGEIPFVATVVSKIVHGRAFGRVGNVGKQNKKWWKWLKS